MGSSRRCSRRTLALRKAILTYWQALVNLFENDRSAARGEMAARKLIVFKHESRLGNAPAHALFERVRVTRNEPSRPPRDFTDYSVEIDQSNLPAGVSVDKRICRSEADLLPLSGLQHLVFCERQCALIHVEGLWQENVFTAEGKLLHERVTRQRTRREAMFVSSAG